MTVKTQDGSRLTQWHSLRVVAAAGVTALLVAACGGDSGCPSAPPFGGEQASGCSDSGNTTPKAADLSITLEPQADERRVVTLTAHTAAGKALLP